MFDCKCDCAYISVIAGIIAGVIVGVLYALGFIEIGIFLTIAFIIGIAGIFFSPIWSLLPFVASSGHCFCSYRRLITVASVGTVITSTATYVVSRAADSVPLLATAVGISTFFAILLLGTIICLTKTVCCRE